ncbi:hypothetical protein C8R48DRAFT_775979 [Suillus tomentosus]|nr:hypothetical protein C8R48DRAFT_775979 [Suillus tomentosus]
MQLSVFLSALISSFVILAAASPMPGAISKRSFERRERGELDTNFQRDLIEEDKKREELKTDFIIYAWYDGPGTGGPRKDLGYDGHD